jgi:hypothetical protein
VAIAAMLLWMCTAAAGTYLLVTCTRKRDSGDVPEEEPAAKVASVAAQAPGAGGAPEPNAGRPVRPKDRFDPPSLRRAKSEPMPGLRALAEFTHPTLAITGLAFWLCYVISRDRVFAAIGFGVLLGAIGAGVSWVTANRRAARAGRGDALLASPRLLALHVAGAALVLLFVVLIVARA